MAYLGQTPAFSPLTSVQIADGIITAAKIANETGTGEVVFSISPTITTPILDNIKIGYTTTATAAGTTTLTVSSTYQQFFTGSTTQTIVLPVVSTLVTGLGYFIQNNSSGVLTVQSSGLNTITTVAAGVAVLCTCISTSGTSAASWNSDIYGLNTANALPVANGGTGTTSTTFVNLATNVTGTLPVANGGTGAATLAGANIAVTSANSTFTGTQTFSGTSNQLAMILTDVAEVANVSAIAATGNVNIDVTTSSVTYFTTSASGNWTVNLRASSGTALNSIMTTGQSVTVAFLVTQGASAYYNSALQVDGTGVTPKWQGGTAPSAGNASSVDVYSYSVFKTANATFTAFASQTKFA